MEGTLLRQAVVVSVAVVAVMVWRGIPRLRRQREKPLARVVGVGLVCLDLIAKVPHFPQPDEKLVTLGLSRQRGGNCASTLSCSAALGADARLVSALGQDPESELALQQLAAAGVDTRLVERSPTNAAPLSLIVVHEATRTIMHTPQPELLSAPTMVACCAALRGAQWLHLDGRHPDAAIAYASAARDLGVRVSLDAERDRPGLEAMLVLTDVLVCPAHYARSRTGQHDLRAALGALFQALPNAALVVATCGSLGCLALAKVDASWATGASPHSKLTVESHVVEKPGLSEDLVLIRCGAFEVQVVDTTGAGDAFLGGLVTFLAAGRGVEAALVGASYVAAQCCTSVGGGTGAPTLADVDRALST